MHSDLERQLSFNPHEPWSVNGLDLIFPDVGPIEDSDLPHDVLVEKAAEIIQRWWQILDGEEIDTTSEIHKRRRGVLREITFQHLRSLASDTTVPKDYKAYQRDRKILSSSARYEAAYLLYVYRYDIVEDGHIPEDETIDCPDTNEHREIAELWKTHNLWQFRNTVYEVIHHPLKGLISGYIEFIEGNWLIRFDDAKMKALLNPSMKQTLQYWIQHTVKPLHTPNTLNSIELNKIFWAFDFPQHNESKANFLRHCQNYWESYLELKELEDAYSEARKNGRNKDIASIIAFKAIEKYHQRFLIPARNIINQTLTERTSKRQTILIAGWIKSLTHMYPSYRTALQFEYEDAHRGFYLELPPAVLMAIGKDLSLEEASHLPKNVTNSIIRQYRRPSKQESIDNIEIDELRIHEATSMNPAIQFEEQEILAEKIREARLSEEEKKVFFLILQQYTESEIAQSTQKAIGTVRSLRARAFKKMKRVIQKI